MICHSSGIGRLKTHKFKKYYYALSLIESYMESNKKWAIFYLLSFVGIIWSMFLFSQNVLIWEALTILIVVFGFIIIFSLFRVFSVEYDELG